MAIELNTPDHLEYNFYPVSNGLFSFRVRATNDAHIALTTGPGESEPMVEIFIGGWNNSKSIIRKNKQKPDVAEANTPNVLNGGEYRGFWIRWYDGVITVGHENESSAFLSWQDHQPFPIQYAGVCTGWGASGSWVIEAPSANRGGNWCPPGQTACWVPASNGQVPPGAVPGGSEASGEPMFVARARHEGALIPGKLVASHGVCYVAWGGGEHPHNDYEVLCGGGNWVRVQGANVPAQAVPAGETEEGEPLFVGRAHNEGSLTVGKVQPSHGVCYIPFGGQELGFDDYEVFVN